MSSKRVRFLRRYRPRPSLENGGTPPRKPGTQLPGPEPNEDGTRVGGVNYHGFLPLFLSHIPRPCLWLSHFPTPRPEQHQRGEKWRERPPLFRVQCSSSPPRYLPARGPVQHSPGEAAPATMIPAGRPGFRRNDPA